MCRVRSVRCTKHRPSSLPAPEHDDIILLTMLPTYLHQMAHEQHSSLYEATTAGISPPLSHPWSHLLAALWMCVCVSDVTSGHSSCVISPIQWYTHQTSEGLRLYWGCDIKSILLQGSTIKTACVFVSVRMSLCRFVCTRSYSHLFVGVCGFAFMYARAVAWGNKEIRHREGALKSSPTSQCHSNSLHLTRRNHNRGSRGIPHWHMTDTARLKGNSTPKRILCTGGMQGKHLLVAKTTQDKSRVYSVILSIREMWKQIGS